jgi:NitT/TauT family transport system ATP-binding protein
METVLELNHIDYSYHTRSGEVKALSDIQIKINAGEFISIVGPSGCGKSTLLSIITGLIRPESGYVILRENTKIGYMLQRDNLFEWRDVYKNILLGLEIQKKLTPEAIAYVDHMIENYGLSDFKHSLPSQLSGGMRQRAALIRTLALKPDILLLDEPFSALDYQTRLEVSDDIGKIIKSESKTAILVTHDISEAISMGDKVIILSKRPGSIKKIVPVNVSIKDRTPFNTRFAPEFQDIFNEIWKEMTGI